MKRIAVITSIILIVVAVAGAAFYMLGGFDRVKAMLQPKNQVRTVTVKGQIVCLPHKSDDNTTLECAVGIKTDDNHYYGLSSSRNSELSATAGTDKTITISGKLQPQKDATYKMDGIIAVNNFKPAN